MPCRPEATWLGDAPDARSPVDGRRRVHTVARERAPPARLDGECSLHRLRAVRHALVWKADLVARRSRGPLDLVGEWLALLFGWPHALWSAWRARRRLRAYGPPAELALRTVSRDHERR